MSEADRVETEFVETIKKFVEPDHFSGITRGHGGRNGNLTDVSAVVNVRGDSVLGLYDQGALLENIDGTLIDTSDMKVVVIDGTFQGRRCRVTITCTGTS